MSSLEFEGKNVEKAVKNACDKLNITPKEVSYKVLSHGSSGIFGLVGAKNARIRVAVPDRTPEFDVDNDYEKHDAPVFEEKVQSEKSFSDSDSSEVPQRRNVEENPLDLAQAVLQRIIDAITSDAAISAEETNGRILLNVAGGNAGVLIGKKGQTLEAIQSLVDKIVNKHNNHHDKIRVQVDVEGYLETRKLNLEKLAMRLADKSKRIRKPISLGQMNGYDRRIVHMALKDDSEVETKSRGEGHMRKLVIFPNNKSPRRQPSH
ncbi:MAG: RNA-binding cell elongation regulator Jag/EloR [Desulfobacterales bacterium]